MRVAELIINWRFIKKLNQRDAATEMGISASSLCRIEKGIVPDGTTLVKLMNWLFGEENEKTNQPALVHARTNSDSQAEHADITAHGSVAE